jgi:hypothetical protein
LGEHCDAVFAALSLADVDDAFVEVDVFDAEGDTFGESESGAVEEACHQEFGTVEVGEDLADLRGREDDGETFRADGVGEGADIAEIAEEDVAVEEDDRIEGLVLGGGGDLESFGEVGEEVMDVGGGEVRGVLGFVEEDKAFDPVGIGLDGTGAEVAEGGGGAELVEESGSRHCSILRSGRLQ